MNRNESYLHSAFIGLCVARWSYLAVNGVPRSGDFGLTAIVGTFFVKDYLGLSAAFLALVLG